MQSITSPTNEKIKEVAKLLKSGKERRLAKAFIVEGIRMSREVPDDRIVRAFVTETELDKIKETEPDFYDRLNRHDLYVVTDAVAKKMSDTETPQGITIVTAMDESRGLSGQLDEKKSLSSSDSSADGKKAVSGKTDQPAFILILERLQDPGNVGNIIRMAEGAGVSKIYISADSADIYSPKVVRSTMGAIFRMKIEVVEDLTKTCDDLAAEGVVRYAAHLNGADFYDCDFTGPVAFMIGNEGNGLTDKLSAKADKLLRIPMEGKVESLNAAMSSGIICYETLRQRRVK